MTTRRGFIAGVVGLLGSLPFIKKGEASKPTEPVAAEGYGCCLGPPGNIYLGVNRATGKVRLPSTVTFVNCEFRGGGDFVYYQDESGQWRRAIDGKPFPHGDPFKMTVC